MLKRLPGRVDPLRLADEGARLEGTVPIAAMPRLAAAVAATDEAAARVELGFGRERDGTATLHGHIEAELTLQCQRCLEAMAWPLRTGLALALAENEIQAERLAATGDVVVLEERTLDLTSLVEDEILLALPLVARHEPAQCPADAQLQAQNEPEEDSRPNPFAVLSRLKQDSDD